MDYLVRGSDGKDYGPVDLVTLRSWVNEGRVVQSTLITETPSNRQMEARLVPDLFPNMPPPAMNMSQPPSYESAPYARPMQQPNQGDYYNNAGGGAVTWAFIDSTLALVLAFVPGAFGGIVMVFGIINAFKAKSAGHKLANIAIGYSIFCAIIWFIGFTKRSGI